MQSSSPEPVDSSQLREIVRAYGVSFDAQPARANVDGELRTIGFDLSLTAVHAEESTKTPAPGCDECLRLWDHLEQLSRAVTTEDPRSTVQVRPYRPVLQYDSHRAMEARVELVLEIRHSTDYNDLVDESESESLKAIIDRLHALGISQRGG